MSDQEQEYSRFTIKLPIDLLDPIDELKDKWGLESRENVLERLLEVVFGESEEDDD